MYDNFSRTYLLSLLRNIHSTTTYTAEQSSNRQQQQQLAYRLRYDLGMGTIIKPTWNTLFSSSTSSSRALGVGRVQMDSKDKEDEACNYIDMNVYLQSANNGVKIEPYETILSSLSKGGGGDVPTTTTFVNLHITPVKYEEIYHPLNQNFIKELITHPNKQIQSKCLLGYGSKSQSKRTHSLINLT